MQDGNVIKTLRKLIPDMECKPGCNECCGPIVFSKWEWTQITDKRKASDINCPYVGKNGCDIYSDRPILCRLFGTVKKMKCPHGCKPKRMLNLKQEASIIRQYGRLFRGGDRSWTV